MKSNIINFYNNDTFGSVYQLRIEMLLRYNVEEYNVKSFDNFNIDV